jgi:nitroreductase
MLKDLVKENRTCRRFYQDVPVTKETLRELVDLARYSASGSNIQPLRYVLSCDPERNRLIFPLLGFAGQLKDWPGPSEGERPTAYIVILGDTQVNKAFFEVDAGLATQSILLGAREKGLGGCMHKSVKRDEMRKILGISERFEILYVLSLGKPKEKVFVEEVGNDGKTGYWRDSEGGHHVPKRRLDDIIIG